MPNFSGKSRISGSLSFRKDLIPSGIDSENFILAYEPVWAIGTGETATVDQIAEAHGDAKAVLSSAYGSNGDNIPILYGGSVNEVNAKSLIRIKDVDGFLIGGGSLQEESFCKIIEKVTENY